MKTQRQEARAGIRAIGPSDIIPDAFLEGLTALSQEFGFWIQGGTLTMIESAPDRSYVCGGFDDRSLRLSDQIEDTAVH